MAESLRVDLPPEIEARIQECERRVASARTERLDLTKSIDETISSMGDDDLDAIPIETFDDPSVVREVDELRARVRRTTGAPPLRARGTPDSSPTPQPGQLLLPRRRVKTI